MGIQIQDSPQALASLFWVGTPSQATHEGHSFLRCTPNYHHNNYDIRWHFSSTGGSDLTPLKKTVIEDDVVPKWSYKDTSKFHSHYDSNGPAHIKGHPTMPLGQSGWVGTAGGGYHWCESPYYPVNGSHFSGANLWVNDSNTSWYVGCTGTPHSSMLDLCGLVLHEYGHLMGIFHTCQSSNVVMCPVLLEGVVRRTLLHDDKRHAEEMYACHPPPAEGCIDTTP